MLAWDSGRLAGSAMGVRLSSGPGLAVALDAMWLVAVAWGRRAGYLAVLFHGFLLLSSAP